MNYLILAVLIALSCSKEVRWYDEVRVPRADDDDNDKLFCSMVDWWKPYFQPVPFSEILTIANLRHVQA